MPYPVEKRIGYAGATEQQVSYKWDPRTGFETIRRWKGPYKLLVNLFAQLQAQGYVFTCDPVTGVNYLLTATIGYSYSGGTIMDNAVPVWELGSTKAEKDLLQADVTVVNSLSAANKALIRENYLSPPATAPAFTGSDAGNAAIVYAFMVEGFTGLPVHAPTLRYTQTVSGGNIAVQAAVTGANVLFLLGTINPPDTLNINLDSLGTSGKTGYQYGWLQDFPTARVAAFNKTQIVTEWTYGLFPTAIFGSPT